MKEKHVCVQMYKFLNDDGPTACKDMFTYMSEYHDVNTRSSSANDLLIPRVNLTLTHRSMRYFGPKIWKEVPYEIKSMRNLELFKEGIYAHKFNWKLQIGQCLPQSHVWVTWVS